MCTWLRTGEHNQSVCLGVCYALRKFCKVGSARIKLKVVTRHQAMLG
jgi:hypothetical protein